MLQLAQEYDSGEPVQIRRIADEHGNSRRGFSCRFFLQLKGAVAGGQHARRRGRLSAGAAAARDHTCRSDRGDGRRRAAADERRQRRRRWSVALLKLCRELDDAQRDRLDDMSLADVVEQAARREPMWYI